MTTIFHKKEKNECIDKINKDAAPEDIIRKYVKDKDEYEFVLTKVKKSNPIGGKGSPWHIELKLDEGKWKLMDID